MKKNVKDQELKNVAGGQEGDEDSSVKCPNCGVYNDYYVITEGSGCDAKAYRVCKKCGHKW